MAIVVIAVGLTAWQVHVDRSVFERFFGVLHPTLVMAGAAVAGTMAMASLQRSSSFAVAGPGSGTDALRFAAWAVPLFAAGAIVADVALRFAEDTNVEMPDAVRFYPSIAVFVELAFHVVPIALLVAVLGAPTGLDTTFWRIAVPVALVEAGLQAAFATSTATSIFSGVQVLLFGLVQVWLFWRFGFVWMLGFRLAYYALWHVAWGAARLELLF